MTGGGGKGLSPEFRRWSILAFALESLLVIAAYLFLLFGLGWQVSDTMEYVIIVIMVFGALTSIFVVWPWYRKLHEGRNDRLREPEKDPGR
jgi:type VI protein secretion system component VasK